MWPVLGFSATPPRIGAELEAFPESVGLNKTEEREAKWRPGTSRI
jgi:hypothetical protein